MIAVRPAAVYHHFAIKKSDGVRIFRTRLKRSDRYRDLATEVPDECERKPCRIGACEKRRTREDLGLIGCTAAATAVVRGSSGIG
jgi:hypothetical protein